MPGDIPWIVPGALGALGLAGIAVWWLAGRWRFRRRSRDEQRLLASFDPAQRIRGALGVLDLGLRRRSAAALLDHVATEEDARVRVAIADAVAQHEGRSRRRRVRRLRAWAADELAARRDAVTPAPTRKQKKEKKRKKMPPRISWRAPAPQS